MKLSARLIILAVAVLGLASVALFLLQVIAPELRGVALHELPQLYSAENKIVGEIVIASYSEYRANAARWSGVYFGCLFGAAFLSALAGLIIKLELLQAWPRLRNDLAATSAMLAALLITLSTTGDFQRKWHANRTAATAMENLAYHIATVKSRAELDAAIAEIQAINEARNNGIVGELVPVRTRDALPSPSQAEPPG
jgi:hypothetical protein